MNELSNDHVSFSQLSCAEECPYAFFLLKMEGIQAVENAFAQAGTLAHQILADWAKGKTPIGKMDEAWIQRFTHEVTAPFPRYLESKGYAAKLFESILKYFESFSGFPGYEIVGAEQEFTSSIGNERFVGIIDLILRSKETGKLTIVDFKSCSRASFRQNKKKMYRQLYLYSKYCCDQFGEFPDRLRFELIKENDHDEISFSREEYIAARKWAEEVIENMQNRDFSDWFDTRPEFFRCTNLCNCRNECRFGNPENHKRKDDKYGTESKPAVA